MRDFLKYTMLFFLSFSKAFCSENRPSLLKNPSQMIMQSTPEPSASSIPFYVLPYDTLPIVEPTVRHRIDSAAQELHQEGILQTHSQGLSEAAKILALQVTRQRIVGVGMLTASASIIVFMGGSPYRISNPEIIPTCIGTCVAGTTIFCDSMIECCCWRHRVNSTKKLIIKLHEKAE